MIIMGEMFFESEELIKKITDEMKKNAHKEDLIEAADIYYDFLMECFEADKRLQAMVDEKLKNEYISIVILPVEDVDDLLSFSFKLACEDEAKVKKRDELVYQELCDICFGGIKPYYLRLLEFYDRLEKGQP